MKLALLPLLALASCSAPPLEPLHAPGVSARFHGAAPSFVTPLGHHASMRLVSAGCVGSRVSLGEATLVSTAERAEYRRPGFTEWYVHGPRGIEQGFTFEQSPCAHGDLELALDVTGLSPRLDQETREIELLDAAGVPRLQYTSLVALDANGRTLPSHMHVAGQTIALRVDTAGARFPIVVDPEVWAQQGATLKLANAKTNDRFGSSAAIDGSTLVVGASGAAYVFVRSGTSWVQQGGALAAADGQAGDEFGYSVAISGDTIAVGARFHDVAGKVDHGSVYVFVRSGTTWTQQGGALATSDGAAGDGLGNAVALSGNTLVVGAEAKNVGGNSLQGATYVFVRSGTTWSQQAILARSNVGATLLFGDAVAVDGDTAVSAANFTSMVYAYTRSGTSWVLETPTGLQVNGNFGSVALSGSTLVASGQGAASVYVRSGSSWTQQGADLPLTGGSGRAVIAGDALVAVTNVYKRSAGTWTLQGPLVPSAAPLATSITALAMSGRYVVVGDSSGTVNGAASAGQAYVFSDVCSSDADCAAIAYCSAARCIARCTADAECPGGQFCPANGVCTAQLAQGTACQLEAGALCKVAGCRVCAGGKPCVDGVCCESACSGSCEACSGLLSGGLNGTCLPIPPDKDPQNECAADADPTSCQADGACSGQRSCRRFAKPGSPCGETSCEAGNVSGKICNGGGACEQAQVACAPYACSADRCGTECASDEECDADSAYCWNGSCTDKKRVGEACEDATECGTGFCVDAVCCNQACQGQCEACAATGECSPVQGPPQGAREACAGDPAECGGECDGVDAEHCSYAPASRVCGKSCEDGVASLSKCDTRGGCDEPKTTSCGGYACGRDACLTACSKDADCAEGFGCADGKCQGGSACADDLQASIVLGKKPVSCGAYLCNPETGACRTDCESVDDCSSGSSCDDTGHCAPTRSAAKDSSGCGCRVMGAPSDTNTSVASLILIGSLVARRRRHRARPSALDGVLS
ncbi:MAG TPA: hypothetical protein VHP33_10050 [Polyangiaceae bacterium]|nr:hypothetical protein [Polyangiaceae bacterium]